MNITLKRAGIAPEVEPCAPGIQPLWFAGLDGAGSRPRRPEEEDLTSRLRALLAASIDVLLLTNARRQIIEVNPAAERLLGYAPAELLNRPIEQIVAANSRSKLRRLFREGAERSDGTGVNVLELLILTRDDTTLPVEAAVAEERIDKTQRWAVALHDLSHRRHLEREILATETLQRQQIGEDLHDDVGQLLTGIGLLCRKLQQRLEGKGLEEAEDVVRIGAFLKEATTKARTLARELVPTPLQAAELPAALQELAARTEYLFEVQCRLDLGASPAGRDDADASHLYRIAQEACHNAIKHGRADRITIGLGLEAAALTLRVSDDGCGFPPDEAQDTGLGLRLMRHRARLMGATLSFEASDRGGVTVTCTIPVAPERRAGAVCAPLAAAV